MAFGCDLPVHWHSQSGLLLVNLGWNGCTILQGNWIFWSRLGLRLFIKSEKHWILFERQWKLRQWSISLQTLYSLYTLQWDSSGKIWFPHYFLELMLIRYILNYTGGPLLAWFFETLEKEPCKQRSDLVLNGQMRIPK